MPATGRSVAGSGGTCGKSDFEQARPGAELLSVADSPAPRDRLRRQGRYRGTFGGRPELGRQERRLGETALYVLPSTSPANAAVPWAERLRWFQLFFDALSTKVASTTSQPPE